MAEETKTKSTGLIEFNKLDAGLMAFKEEFKEVPDFTDDIGYLQGKEDIAKYRDYKKRATDTHKMAKAEIKKVTDGLNAQKLKIDDVLEKTFRPYLNAKKEQDDIEKEAAAARKAEKERRRKEITDRLDVMREVYAQAVGLDSDKIMFVLTEQEGKEFTEEYFGDQVATATALHAAMVGKLKTLYESKKKNEEEEARIKKEREQLEADKEKQRVIDEAAATKKREADEAEAEKMRKENAELKAKNEIMQIKQEKFDEEKRQFEEDKKKAKEEEKRKDEIIEQAKQEEIKKHEAKLCQEEAEKKAEEESEERHVELVRKLKDFTDLERASSLINAIEHKEIPYLRLNWLEK